VLVDPQGGVFGVYTPAAAGDGGSMASEFMWHELATPDYAAAQRFYFELFGWKELATHDMGGDVGKYSLFGVGSTQYGGMFNRPAHLPGSFPHWLAYANVASAAKAAEAAKAAGGRVLNGPMQVPGGGWIVQLLDAQGAALAVHQAPAAASAAAPAKPKPAAAKPAAAKPAAAKPAAAAAKPAAPAAKKKSSGKKQAARKKKAAPKAKKAVSKAKRTTRKAAAKRRKPAPKKAAKKRPAARRKK